MIVCNLIYQISFCQSEYKIFGRITDNSTGEYLIGSSIFCAENQEGAITNNYGYFSIKLPTGLHKIKVSHIGYEQITKEIFLSKDYEMNITMTSDIKTLEEVIISANSGKDKIESTKLGFHDLKPKQLLNIPSVAGIPDVLKTIQLLPGIQTSNEGTIGFNVRGGSVDQNLILLDEAPIYNPSHALGFFSTINTDLIKNFSIYKGDFPAKYGGRASSVTDIRLREGNNQTHLFKIDAGVIASGVSIEGPIKKNKSSFILGGRYSYAGWMANNASKIARLIYLPALNNFYDGNNVYFYDINAKVNYEFSNTNKLYLSFYNGFDNFFAKNIDDLSIMRWGNTAITLRWNHRYRADLFANTSIIYSKYHYSNTYGEPSSEKRWTSSITNFNLKHDLDYYPNTYNHITIGMGIECFEILPGKIEDKDTLGILFKTEMEVRNCIQPYFYANNEHRLSENFILNYGFRLSMFGILGNGYSYSYSSNYETIYDSTWHSKNAIEKFNIFIEPRIAFTYKVSPKHSIKMAYTRVNQSIHLMSNTSVSLPNDVWLPADNNIHPITSDEISFGYSRILNSSSNITFTMEGYYKKQKNIIDYIDNAQLIMNKHISTQLRHGKANANGIEFMLQKENGLFNGWLSYSYSIVKHQIVGINEGKTYFPRYQKPHNISLVLNYNITKRVTINSVFKYNSGGYITIPAGTFYYNGASFNYYTSRNSYELPSYHRLDIGMKIRSRLNNSHKWKGEWDLGIYNIYNRKNIFSLYTRAAWESISIYKMYVFGFTPYINYSIKF